MAKRSWIWRVLTVIGLMLVGTLVFAATADSTASTVYVDVPNDYSMKYLNMLFGNIGNTLNGSLTGQTVGHLFYIFNQGILIASGIWVLLALIKILGKLLDGNVQEISKEGKTFLSICLGVILIIPSPSTGYSTIQSLIMKVVVQGVELANGIWEYQVENFRHHVHVYDNPPQEMAWANNDYANGQDYTYNSIMQKQVTNANFTNSGKGTDSSSGKGTDSSQVDKLMYRILQLEVLYYQSQMACEAEGDCDTSVTPPSLVVSSNSRNSVDINTDYVTGSPATVTVKISGVDYGVTDTSDKDSYYTTAASDAMCDANEAVQAGIDEAKAKGELADTTDLPYPNALCEDVFSADLRTAAQTLSPLAKSYACSTDTNNTSVCSGVSDVDTSTAASTVIGLLTSMSTSITNSLSLMLLQTDATNGSANIDSNSTTCKARWMQQGDALPSYNEADMAIYEAQMDAYNAMNTVIGQSQVDLNHNETYQTYSSGKYAEHYLLMEGTGTDNGCWGDVITCHEANHEYMSVGELGAWGSSAGAVEYSDDQSRDSDDEQTRLKTCKDWLQNGHTEDVGYNSGQALFGEDGGITWTETTKTKDHSYNGGYGASYTTTTTEKTKTMGELDSSLAWMNEDISDDEMTWLCKNYGSILYQIWNDRRDYAKTDGAHGLSKDEEVALLKLIPDPSQFSVDPTQFDDYDNKTSIYNSDYNPLTDGEPQKPSPIDLTSEAQYTGTIDSCTDVLADRMEQVGWIMAGSYYWLIAHQDQEMVTTKGEDKNDFLSWSSGKKMYEALKNFSFSDNGPTGDNLISTDSLSTAVNNKIIQQFVNTGTSIGQIDTMDSSSTGIAAQLAWAGTAFNAVISGEADAIGSYKNMSSVKSQMADTGDNSDQPNLKATAKKSTGKSLFGGLYSIQSSLFPQLRNQVYYLESFILNVAQQLNNPNLDPQSLLTNIGIGMIYQGGYATLGYFHMMISLMIAVVTTVIIMACMIMIPVGGIIVASLGTAALTMMVTFVKIMGGILKKIGTSFAVMGAVLAFYVPLYPWIVFTFAAIGWFVAVIEAMAAGPLICLNMTNPQGHELLGSVKQAIMLLLSIFIRPALMILSFITAMILARVALSFMIQGFLTLLGTIFNNNASDYCMYVFNTVTDASSAAVCDGSKATSLNLWNTMFNLSQHSADIGDQQYRDTINAAYAAASDINSQDVLSSYVPDNYKTSSALDGRPGPDDYVGVFQFYIMMLSMPIMLGMLTYMTYEIINNAYSLIYVLPENVMKWIGGQAAGDSASVKQSIGGAKQATEKSSQSAGKGMSESTKAGEGSAASAGKGVSAGVQKGVSVGQDQFGKKGGGGAQD